ncbi:MAG: tRNA (guanine(10)-N(2))-dimethyltransferase [Nanoarchaeota archaeon]|nr:tRNA (guanine(10)-N(2))-dimethyltransferase [Nanoarchaeota archaeon]
MIKQITEGNAIINISSEEKISRSLPVFYNPVMKLNRDTSVLLLDSVSDKDMQMALPLAASGIRGIRFLKELKKSKIKSIAFNDLSGRAIQEIKKNNEINGLSENTKIQISQEDANLFMLNSTGFDYIDIDPFGTPGPFLDSASVRISRGGILAVTATDTSALSGSFSRTTKRKYHAKSLKNEFMHETGLRILIRKVQLHGADHGKALTPIFSYSKEHYMRVFFRCEKGKQKVDELMNQHGYVLYCSKCLFRKTVNDIFNKRKCPSCGSDLVYAGQLWLGRLWDTELVKKMYSKIKTEEKELYDLLFAVNEEAKTETIGFYDLSLIAKRHKVHRIPKIEALIKRLGNKGFFASRTHFKGDGLRTDADIDELVNIFRQMN